MVGTSGASGLRLPEVMAIGRTLPALASGSTETMESSSRSTWPPPTSTSAGCVPL